jgi:hypothetical protein
VKGSTASIGHRLRILSLFAAAFVVGATLTFGIATLGGVVARTELSFAWRTGLASASLVALALVDLFAARRGCYCPLGWGRQTPRTLVHRYGPAAGVAAWGFDTGLAITTFRVAAITWGALVLTALGFSSWWTGPAYGAGFVVPLLTSLLTPTDAGKLEGLLRRRSVVQAISAAVLLMSGAFLLSRLIV